MYINLRHRPLGYQKDTPYFTLRLLLPTAYSYEPGLIRLIYH
jgi:hypothetical protein